MRLLVKIATLVFLVLIIMQLIRLAVPPFWCGSVLHNKQQHWQENKDDYDLVFLGTSRINHGVDPQKFEQEVSKTSGKQVTSFNWGISGASAGELHYLFNKIIANPPKKLQVILLEIPSIGSAVGNKFCIENLHTDRNKYWQDWNSNSFALDTYEGFRSQKEELLNRETSKSLHAPSLEGVSFTVKKNYYTNYLENLFNVGMLSGIMEYEIEGHEKGNGLGKNLDGYNNINKSKFRGVKKARKGFLKSKQRLNDTKRQKAIACWQEGTESKANEKLLAELNQMIEQAANKNIKLVIIAPPLMAPDAYCELAPTYYALPIKNRLAFTHPASYGDFYSLDHTWDGNHVNHKGALLFSEHLAIKVGAYIN